MSKVDVSTEILIERPVSEVASFAADPDNATIWYENIKSVEWKVGPPLGIGSRIAFKAKFLGRQLVYVYEVVSFVPEEYLVMRTSEGSFPMETIYTWQSVQDGKTRMILRNSGVPTGFLKILIPFISSAMRRANQKDLRRLKDVLERQIPRR